MSGSSRADTPMAMRIFCASRYVKRTRKRAFSAEHIKLVDGTVFDVDIHTIPAIGAEPRHTHFDIRFLLEIDDRLPVPGNDESHEVLWVPVYEASRFNNNLSTYRMVDKTRRLRSL